MKKYVIILITILSVVLETYSQSQEQNYIQTRTYLYQENSEFLDEIQYFDGLGRPNQTVKVGITPSKSDFISLKTYDLFGLENRNWLPTAVSNNKGMFINDEDYLTDLATNSYNDLSPVSSIEYEEYPISRVKVQYGVGESWYKNRKAIKTNYLTNNSTTYICYNLEYLPEDWPWVIIKSNGLYGDKELIVEETEDEDGNLSYIYKDKINRTVMTRQLNGWGQYQEYLDTYYVYDDSGNLICVLPPIAVDLFPNIKIKGYLIGEDDDIIENYGYIYHYDEHNRCFYKKLPGCMPIYYVFDKAGRLVLSQNGEQRKDNRWSFTKYDDFGRVIITGEQLINDTHKNLRNKYANIVVTEKAVADNPGPPYGYTWNSLSEVNYLGVLTVNYYDNYWLLNQNQSYFQYNKQDGYGEWHNPNEYSYKGLLTATRNMYLDGSGESITFMYYDEKGQLVQTKSTNHMGGLEKEYIAYNFTGQPIKKMHEHSTSSGSTVKELYIYEYDHAGRLITTRHKLNNQAEVILAKNEYNEQGQLKSNIPGNQNGLKINYSYNIRSWVTRINNPEFDEKIYYNGHGYSAFGNYYNGNISGIIINDLQEYEYYYDKLSRLTMSESYDRSYGYDYYTTNYSYDKHGNITSIKRNSEHIDGAYIDDLRLIYTGNQLKSVKDYTEEVDPDYSFAAGDFKDYANTSVEYTFNTNGAMTQDLNRGISSIKYNLLDLPTEVEIKSPVAEAKNNYVYRADGVKLKMVQKWNPYFQTNPIIGSSVNAALLYQSKTTDYVGNKIYENGKLKKILTENGYINEQGTYYYYIKDHLGNNRLVVSSSNTDQINDYYPFGLAYVNNMEPEHQQYKFGGKEFDPMHGLNQYDFHARQYDPTVARFMSLDPLAEKYYSWSPYVYCLNNPIKFVDKDGKQVGFPMVSPWGTSEQVASYVYQQRAEQQKVVATQNHASPDAITMGMEINSSVLPISIFIGITIPLQGEKVGEPHLNLGLGMSASTSGGNIISTTPKITFTHSIGLDAEFKPSDIEGASNEISVGYRNTLISGAKNITEKGTDKEVYTFGLSASGSKSPNAGAAIMETKVVSFERIYEIINNLIGK